MPGDRILLTIFAKGSSPADTDKAIRALSALGELVSAPEGRGTLTYAFVKTSPTELMLTEIYEDSKGFLDHLALDGFSTHIKTLTDSVSLEKVLCSFENPSNITTEAKKALDGFNAQYVEHVAGFFVHPSRV